MNRAEQFPREPQFLGEVNALLHAASTEPSIPLDISAETISQEDRGLQRHLYRSFLRAIATARSLERNQASNRIDYFPTFFNERWLWELTSKKIATLALDSHLSFLARQHAVAHKAEQSFRERWEDLQEELYADQQPYAMDLIASLQKAPKVVSYTDRNGHIRQKNVLGVTAIAPTGAGKSHLIEMCTTVIADSAVDRHIVLVVPSLSLQRQLLQKFTEDLPHLRIGGLSGEISDSPAENDLMIITIEAFNAHFRNNSLQGQPIDVVMIDETHHLTEPQFKQTLLEEWDGYTMGFTATPAYSLDKDVRALLPHIIEHSNTMELIEAGRLNDGQIFTFLVDDELLQKVAAHYGVELSTGEIKAAVRMLLDNIVIDFVKPLIEEGRRGIIFCEPGDDAWNARELARRLSEEESAQLSDGRPIRAAAMYSLGKNQHEVMRQYREGELDVVTTIDTGRESLDAEFNFVILNTTVTSRLRGIQMVGRGIRYNERFGVTIYAQFINNVSSLIPEKHRPFFIEEAFDSIPSLFRQGRTLRSKPVHSKKSGAERQPKEAINTESPKESSAIVDISSLKPILQTILTKFDRQPVGKSLLSGKQEAWVLEDNMQALHMALLGHDDIDERKAMKILRAAGYTWRGKREEVNGEKRLAHYYDREAIEYLLSKLPSGRVVFNKLEAAIYLGITVELFEYLENQPENAIKGQEFVRAGRKTAICYTEETLRHAKAIVQKVPGIQPGSKPASDVAAEIGIEVRTLRRMLGLEKSDRYHINKIFHLTAEEVSEAKRIFYQYPEALSTDKHLNAICDAVGIDTRIAKNEMTPEEKAQGVEKRYKDKRGYTLTGIVYPQQVWVKLEERLRQLKPRPLEAHMIHLNKRTLGSMVRFGAKLNIEELVNKLTDQGYKVRKIAIVDNKGSSYAVSWEIIAALQREYGQPRLTKRTPKLDFNRLPNGPYDVNPEKIAYAQEVQQRFLRPEQLQSYNLSDPATTVFSLSPIDE